MVLKDFLSGVHREVRERTAIHASSAGPLDMGDGSIAK
jgi:hypothetical protein